MDIESLIAATSRAQQASEAGIGNCSRIWHVGLFFDGVGRNIERDAPQLRLSNIARLYRAFPDLLYDSSFNSYLKLYISGLGTPFHENMAEKLHTAMDGAQSSIFDDLKDHPKDRAKEAGKELLKGKKWYEVLGGQVKKLHNPAEWRELRNAIRNNVLKKVSIEATPWLRDNPLMADFLLTGVDTRINSTKTTFSRAYEDAKSHSEVPIKLISVSVFGFDLGAALARKFIDILLNDICQKQGDKFLYQGVPVDIIFTGLFDCSRHTPASSNNGLDYFVAYAGGPLRGVSAVLGEKAIDQNTPLPKAVKSALHLVAAHERRCWRRIYRLGSDSDKHREELLPGCSEDIGGGLKSDEQKPSAELCRVALHRMYREATMAGVPFSDFRSLWKTDIDVAAYFIMNDPVAGKSVEYWVNCYQRAVPAKRLSLQALNHHLDSYINWLGKQYYLYRCECLRLEKEREDRMLSAGASVGMLGISRDAMKFDDKYPELKKYWGWLEDVHSVALKLKNSMENHPFDKRRNINPGVYDLAWRRAKNFLAYAQAAYEGKPQPLPEDNAPGEIFASLVHDLQTVSAGATITEDFLVVRSMDRLDG